MRQRAGPARPGEVGPSLAGRLRQLAQLNNWLVGSAVLVAAATFFVEFFSFLPRIEQLRAASRAVLAGNDGMLDQETSIRGYLLGGRDPRFLRPYKEGREAVYAANEALLRHLTAHPAFMERFVRMSVAQERWQSEYAEAVVASAPGAEPPPTLGRVRFGEYRQHAVALERAVEHRLRQLVRIHDAALATSGVLQLLLFFAVLIAGRRQISALSAALLRPVDALLATMKAAAAGRLEPPTPSGGPAELAQLEHGLGAMVAALADARAALEEEAHAAQRRAASLRQILDAARELSGSLNLRYVVRALAKSALATSGLARAVVWLVDDDPKRLTPFFDSEGPSGNPLGLEPVEIGATAVGQAARYGRSIFAVPDGAPKPDGEEAPPSELERLAVPLIVGARVVAVLELGGPGAARMKGERPDLLETLEILASHGAAAIQSARLHQTIEERSQRDPLTALYNRRRLEDDLAAEFRRSRRYGRPLAFVMLDVDHFKGLNDAFGHQRGDQVLEAIGHLLGGAARTTDTAYRYGGEEFAVLLRETDLAGAAELAERLRQGIERHFAREAARVTASVGVAELEDDMASAAALVEAADRALYEAKHEGRNRVATAAPMRQLPARS
jgi:diguanylate cyclase (GGDEF)-like protein